MPKPKRRTRKPAPRRRRASVSPLERLRGLALPHLEPHHVDILALALVLAGIFLACVAYLHWSGGTLGSGAVTAMRFTCGALGYAVPTLFVISGGVILARELRPPARPLRTGALCMTAALTLGLAAGTLGVGPGA